MMQLPPYLKPGDKVGIAAPARWVEKGDLDFFISALKGEGWEVVTGNVYDRVDQLSGSDRERLSDLQSMFDDKDIRAVFCARGGYGTVRLLGGIDYRGLAAFPKWVAGFSDITALHSAILMRIGLSVIHSAMPYTLRDGKDPEGLASLLAMLKGDLPSFEIKNVYPNHTGRSNASPANLNREGRAQGILLGGNLSVLYSLTGSQYQLPTRGAILFLEDLDEYLYHIDRMMMNLKLSGMLEGLAGLIIGGMSDMNDNEVPWGKSAYEIIREAAEPYDFPVCFGFPAGHQVPNLALQMGREVHLEVSSDISYLDYIK